jgi:hypothetical protein
MLARVKRLFGLGAAARPPAPNTALRTDYGEQDTIEITYSPSGAHRAAITRDRTGVIRVHSESWDVSDFHVGGSAWWRHDHTSITDTVDRARLIAQELLKLTAEHGE